MQRMRATPHNVVAAYGDRASAQRAIERLKEDGIDSSSISMDTHEDLAMVANVEGREEREAIFGGPGVIATKSQARGSVLWSLAWGALGAVLGWLIGALLFATQGAVITAISAGVAGLTFGGTVGGFVRPRRKEGPQRSLSGYTSAVGVHSDDLSVVERAEALLAVTDAVRVERFDAEGQPIGRPDAGRDPSEETT